MFRFDFAEVEVAIGEAAENYAIGRAIGNGSCMGEVSQFVVVAAEASNVADDCLEVGQVRFVVCCLKLELPGCG